MPGATNRPAKSSQEVIPTKDFYGRHFFAFTDNCSKACADDQFGVKGLSSSGAGFLPSVYSSPLPQAIVRSIGPLVDEHDVDRYLLINYEASDIQAAVMRAHMPLARVCIFVPPCLQAVATAMAVCKVEQTEVTEWRVRVDHRLGCACCKDADSAMKRIEMIADTITDVESGHHRAKLNTPETDWVDYIDRAWVEKILYYKDDQGSSLKTAEHGKMDHNYAEMRGMLTHNGRIRSKTVAVILADLDNASWIINSSSFPAVKRQPRAGEMFSLKTEHFGTGGKFLRTFEGIFATTGGLKRRRVDSPPPEAEEATKNPKTHASK